MTILSGVIFGLLAGWLTLTLFNPLSLLLIPALLSGLLFQVNFQRKPQLYLAAGFGLTLCLEFMGIFRPGSIVFCYGMALFILPLAQRLLVALDPFLRYLITVIFLYAAFNWLAFPLGGATGRLVYLLPSLVIVLLVAVGYYRVRYHNIYE